MANFKTKVKNRIILLISVFISLLLIYLVLYFNQDKLLNMPKRIMSFNSGALVSVEFLLLVFIFRNIKDLKSETKLKKLYIKENDERTTMILQKTGGIGINVCIVGFIFATIIAGFFCEIVFFTLLGVTLFTALVKAIFKTYYYKKL